MKKKIKVKVGWYKLLAEALDYAAERACDRCDKYNDPGLTEGQRYTLKDAFVESFWLAIDDRQIEFVDYWIGGPSKS